MQETRCGRGPNQGDTMRSLKDKMRPDCFFLFVLFFLVLNKEKEAKISFQRAHLTVDGNTVTMRLYLSSSYTLHALNNFSCNLLPLVKF